MKLNEIDISLLNREKLNNQAKFKKPGLLAQLRICS